MTSTLVDRVTKRRADALDYRNKKQFERALEELQETIDDLEEELGAVRRGQSKGDECLTLKMLSETWGQRGGTLRREGKLPEALKAYNEGNIYEDLRRQRCTDKDTYNLLQHEVVRLLIEPALIDQPAFVADLEKVRTVIADQVKNGRDDSWALADLILVQFLCNDDADRVLADLEKRQSEKTFYKSTFDVVAALIAEGLGRGNPLGDRLEAFRRLLQRKGGLS